MYVNNEIGVIQDIAAIAELTRSRGIVFHVDAAQATGKIVVDLAQLKVDLMSFSAHKTYGPKGVGALFVRRKPRVRLEAQMHGGGHERGLRSGTLPTHQIVGMGEAFRLAREEMATDNERIRMLRDRLWAGISQTEQVFLNGDLGTARAAQPERELQLRRRRKHDHGDEGRRRFFRFGLYFGQSGTILCIARAGAQRRTGAQLDPLYGRALYDAGRDRLYDRSGDAAGGAAARDVSAMGDV